MKPWLTLSVLFLISCGVTKQEEMIEATGTSPLESNIDSQLFDSQGCQLEKLSLDVNLSSPFTINEAIDLINALPKPLELPCFLQALQRPLKVNATSSILSVQPAVGRKSPRLFIFMDKLVLSITPDGVGKNLLELSFMYNNQESLKGELQFPITGRISYSAPYKRVNTLGQSSCSGCHSKEQRDFTVTSTIAYKSIALKPDTAKNVPLTQLYSEYYQCSFVSDTSYRCKILRSLYDNGTLIQAYFPSSTSTYFESLGF